MKVKTFKPVLMSLEEITAFSKLKDGERLDLPAVAGIRQTCYIEKQDGEPVLFRGATPVVYSAVKMAEPSKVGITSANQDETREALEKGFGATTTRGGGVVIHFHIENRDGSKYEPNSINFDDGDINAKVIAVIDSQETKADAMECVGLATPQFYQF